MAQSHNAHFIASIYSGHYILALPLMFLHFQFLSWKTKNQVKKINMRWMGFHHVPKQKEHAKCI